MSESQQITLSREEALNLCRCLVNAHKLLMARKDYQVEDFARCSKTLTNLGLTIDRLREFLSTSVDEDLDKDNEKNQKGEEYVADKPFPR